MRRNTRATRSKPPPMAIPMIAMDERTARSAWGRPSIATTSDRERALDGRDHDRAGRVILDHGDPRPRLERLVGVRGVGVEGLRATANGDHDLTEPSGRDPSGHPPDLPDHLVIYHPRRNCRPWRSVPPYPASRPSRGGAISPFDPPRHRFHAHRPAKNSARS